jgi:hypothetical protein
MNMQSLGSLVFLVISSVYSLPSNHYYSGNGGFANLCPSTSCTTNTCPTGQYRKDCGAAIPPSGSDAAPYAFEGVCTTCTLKPANSVYSPYSNGVTVALSDATCPFTCDAGFTLNAQGACVATLCATPDISTNQQLVPGATSPSCNKQCKPGTFGSPAINPTSCTPCARGQVSAAGATSCTPCAAGSIASETGMEQCTACQPVGGIQTFAASSGLSACTLCTATCTNGQFKSGCGGNNAGSCTSCSN